MGIRQKNVSFGPVKRIVSFRSVSNPSSKAKRQNYNTGAAIFLFRNGVRNVVDKPSAALPVLELSAAFVTVDYRSCIGNSQFIYLNYSSHSVLLVNNISGTKSQNNQQILGK